MADNPVSQYSYLTRNRPSTSDLYGLLGEINQKLGGDGSSAGFTAKVPDKPSNIARSYIGESWKSREEVKKTLPDIFQSLLNDITRGSMTPEEARYSYLDLVRSTGSNLSEGYKKAETLANSPMGFAPEKNYERYKPAASLAFEQLLGRNIGDAEFKNYVSAAQGLGITKGPDFQAFLGETLLSSPEYKAQAVIFDPDKVSKAINTFKSGPSVSEYNAMLGSIGK